MPDDRAATGRDDAMSQTQTDPSFEVEASDSGEQLWPMGAVTRRTGIGEHTLRAWERRFGFPTPRRLPSGHRRYTAAQVERLLLIGTALALGHRAGDVVPLATEQLEQLLERHDVPARIAAGDDRTDWVPELLEAARRLDAGAVSERLRREALTLGVTRFLKDRVVPLLAEAGEAWSRGELGVRHEHLLSGCVEDQLRAIRGSLDVHATGRPVVLATLPGERHGLGLQLVAVVAAAVGRRVRLLGADTPVEEIAAAAETLQAASVGLSISPVAAEEATLRQVEELRRRLPAEVRLWLGGAGARRLGSLGADVELVADLDRLEQVVSELAD